MPNDDRTWATVGGGDTDRPNEGSTDLVSEVGIELIGDNSADVICLDEGPEITHGLRLANCGQEGSRSLMGPRRGRLSTRA